MGSGWMHINWWMESLSDGASLKGAKPAKQLLVESNKRSEGLSCCVGMMYISAHVTHTA